MRTRRLLVVLLTSAILAIAIPLVSQSNWFQQIAPLQKAAAQAYDAEMSREGKDCPNAKTTTDMNMCLAGALKQTQANFDAFYDPLKKLLEGDGSDTFNAQALDSSQQAWLAYKKSACKAVGQFYRGGTIMPSAVMNCEIRLIRSRMKDLNELYGTPLRH